MQGHGHIGRLGAAALAGLLGATAAAQGENPVRAQQQRQARLDADALALIRERTRALAAALAQPPPPPRERSLEGTVHALEGDTLYLRTQAAVVPLKLQPSTRLIGRAHRPGASGRRPATPAQRLRGQLHEGEVVRARFTVSTEAGDAVNLATTLQPVPPPAPPQRPQPPAAPAR